jgi:hypothetical protein
MQTVMEELGDQCKIVFAGLVLESAGKWGRDTECYNVEGKSANLFLQCRLSVQSSELGPPDPLT